MKRKKKTISLVTEKGKDIMLEQLRQRVITGEVPAAKMAQEVRDLDGIKKSKNEMLLKVKIENDLLPVAKVAKLSMTQTRVEISARHLGIHLALDWCLSKSMNKVTSCDYVIEQFHFSETHNPHAKGGIWTLYEEQREHVDADTLRFISEHEGKPLVMLFVPGYTVTESPGGLIVKGDCWQWRGGMTKAKHCKNSTLKAATDPAEKEKILASIPK